MSDDPAQRARDDEEFMMVTRDIIEDYRQQVLREGLAEVRQNSIAEGERKLLLRLLRRRFGAEVSADTERRVAAASTAQVEVWGERVLSATTLAELLAD